MSSRFGQKTVDLRSHVQFYCRRLTRLLPMYYLVFPALLYFGTLHLTDDDYEQLLDETKWSAALSYNIRGLFQMKDYFSRVHSTSYLTHTWSLCCEIQYYLVAPVFFFFERRKNVFGYFVLLVALGGSLFTHVYLSGSWSYEMLTARVWQFQCGYVAFRLRDFGK
ncbi:hypothetical protein L596_010713 [Steinernema carpocapsae]|uniref:Acyltransferase 3 domain-containing protein n=1 Tax=Steinernema carpocapsae TaxID=34508 RepID=A0A4V6A735_STECR|nr:hypothetical protein L596_010713 [Steinernema carpocapsae]